MSTSRFLVPCALALAATLNAQSARPTRADLTVNSAWLADHLKDVRVQLREEWESVVQDGIMRGGGSIYYHVGSYTCSNGKWKGEMTVREHEPALVTELFARKIVTMGFMGTYNDDGAEFEATALVGKRSARLKMVLRLLIPDQEDGEVR